MEAELFVGKVMHARLQVPRYRFDYRVFSLLLDIDRIDSADQRLKIFSRNRFNLFSFYDRDHLAPGTQGGLRDWVEKTLAARGIDLGGGRVRLLCFPRVLGFVFNPMSVWYCEHADGTLRAILCEVRNTFGERHCYLLHNAGGQRLEWGARLSHAKRFHVSPFMDMDGEYTFRFPEPSDRLELSILERIQGKRTLVATQRMTRTALTDRALLALALAMPLMTFKIVFAIHWQALKIWLRGARFRSKPAPPVDEVSHDVR